MRTRTQIANELVQLSPVEKRELAELLMASAESEASAGAISDAQRFELRARLAHHRAHPEAPGITLQELKTRLLGQAE